VNFGPHFSAILRSPREGLQGNQILWAKVQKQKKSFWGSSFENDSDFSKLVNFGPHILTFLERLQKRLQATKTLCTKV